MASVIRSLKQTFQKLGEPSSAEQRYRTQMIAAKEEFNSRWEAPPRNTSNITEYERVRTIGTGNYLIQYVFFTDET